MKTPNQLAPTLWLCALLGWGAGSGRAQNYAVLHAFGTNTMGVSPVGSLVASPAGWLYGATASGGRGGRGQVFRVQPDGSAYTSLKDFNGRDGAWPLAGLVLAGEWLYGVTQGGGSNDLGTVFKVQTNGDSFTLLREFALEDGAFPEARLAVIGETLFGITSGGGPDNEGVLFKLNPDGSGFAVLKEFAMEGGAYPAALIASDGTLYGTTTEGGTNGGGTLYRLNLDASGFTVLKDFDEAEGAWPRGELGLEGNTLYGTTSGGGAKFGGTVFKVNASGSDYVVLHEFETSDPSQGANPGAGVVLRDSTLYGTTAEGGASGFGVVFKLSTNGTDFAVVKDFADYAADGAYPQGSLLWWETNLIGAVAEGGGPGYGALFHLQPDGSGFARFLDCKGGDGWLPVGALTIDGPTLYGVTESGGSSGHGTVFRMNTDGSGYAILKDFTNVLEGFQPCGDLLRVGPTLFGATSYGGEQDAGVVYRLETDGSGFSVLKQFGGTNGLHPRGGLSWSGNLLYGAFRGEPDRNPGGLFQLATNGDNFRVILPLAGGTEMQPNGGLLPVGEWLYGTTIYGGSANAGTLFRVHPDGTGHEVLKVFDGPEGSGPRPGLIRSGATLYGATEGGGHGYGTLFRINLDGSDFTVLYTFDWVIGSLPWGDLVLAEDKLYGATVTGGAHGSGTLFCIGTNGAGFAVLHDFDSSAYYPQGALRMVGDTIYGTLSGGGDLEAGVVFTLSPGPPRLTTAPEDTLACAGNTVWFSAQASGYPPPTSQWYCSSGAIAGATNLTLVLTNVQFAATGDYFLVVTNPYGSATSRWARLTVMDPYFRYWPASQSLNAGDTARFVSEAAGTPPVSFQWFKGATPLTNDARIAGAQSFSLTISNVLKADEGEYYLVAGNVYSYATGNVATLTVADPVIARQPASLTTVPWATVQFGVAVVGTAPISYQWRQDGAALADETAAQLTLNSVQRAAAGNYDVVVHNAYGRMTSAVATLTVNLPVTYSQPHDYSGNDGRWPAAGLVLAAGKLYGTTSGSTYNGYGTVFRMSTNGADYTVLKRFQAAEGSPYAGLVQVGSTLYGTTSRGGSNDAGTVFRINADGTAYAILKHFSGADGAGPETDLIAVGATLYGTTLRGGSADFGTVFKLNTDGSGFTTLKHFTGPDGREPKGRLVWADSILFGTTVFGGTAGNGTIFMLNPDGSDYTVLHHFATAAPDGAYPYAGLVLAGSTLYGTSTSGGIFTNGFWGGTVFKIETNGTGFTVLKSFTGPDGREPRAHLLWSGANLYGTTFGQYQGGASNVGTVFVLRTNGGEFQVLKHFSGGDGANPVSPVVMAGFRLYGTTFYGGTNNLGVVFSLALTLPPGIEHAPTDRSVESGAPAALTVRASGVPPPGYQWYFNSTTAIPGATNATLELGGVEFTNAGLYCVVATNAGGAATSAPVTLSVVAPVPRRTVPGLTLAGMPASALELEACADLRSVVWTTLDTVVLTGTSQWWFDLSEPLPSQRFYRSVDTASPSKNPAIPARLQLDLVPALTLTGSPGDSVRVDAINAFGPIDAWFTLNTVTLTNPSQLYFDVTAPGQPARLYRVMPIP